MNNYVALLQYKIKKRVKFWLISPILGNPQQNL